MSYLNVPTETIGTAATDSTVGPVVKAVIVGAQDGGTYVPVPVSSNGHLEVAIHEPVSAFGEVRMVRPIAQVQIDAVYGVPTTDVETSTASGGGATASGNLFQCTTGTSVGAYGVIQSRRLVKYNAGQGIVIRFTTCFPTAGVANSQVSAGAFNAEDGLFVGYYGATFGFMRRIAGAAGIYRLTVTNRATAAETFTITLNGTAFVTASTGGALADVNATAEFIAEQGSLYTGWYSSVSPTSNGATVTFIQGTPGSTGGAFTMTSTGAATGTFATVQAGAANDSTTGFVAQTAWNVDRLNGSGGALNPSGILLDPAKLNVWEIVLGYLGASMIELRWMSPNGEFNAVHQIQYPNTATIPAFKNPCFRVGLVAASLGSTTALTAQSGSAAAFIDGDVYTVRDPFTAKNFNYSASATEYVALALRVRGEFASVINLRQVFAITAMAACETANRLIAIRFVLNPTMTGAVNWGYVNQSLSCMEYATPTTIVASGGQEVASVITGTTAVLDLQQLDLRLEPGDVLALAVKTVTSTASAAVAVNWQER